MAAESVRQVRNSLRRVTFPPEKDIERTRRIDDEEERGKFSGRPKVFLPKQKELIGEGQFLPKPEGPKEQKLTERVDFLQKWTLSVRIDKTERGSSCRNGLFLPK